MTTAALELYLDASVEDIHLPLGLGSRHLAAASISQRLGVVAIVVSESGVVRVFHAGELEATLIPELWLLDRHQLRGRGPDEHADSTNSAVIRRGHGGPQGQTSGRHFIY